MSHAPTFKTKPKLLALAWPIFVEQGLHVMTGTVDTFMVAHISDQAVAGLGVAHQIVVLAIILFNFVGIGASVSVTHSLGGGDPAGARRVATTAIATNFWIGAIISTTVFLLAKPLLLLMHLPPELMRYGLPFLTIMGGTLFLESINMAISAVLRAHGHTRESMFITLGQNILNAAGNAVFLFGLFGAPKLGVEGVAMSTVFSRLVALGALWILLKRQTGIRLKFGDLFRVSFARLKPILHIGLPAAGENVSWWVAFMTMTSFTGLLGGDAVVVQSYTMQILYVVIIFSISIALGTEIIIGHLIGAGEFEEAYRELMKNLRTSLMLATGAICIVALFAPLLLRLFTSNPAVIAGGALLLRMSLLLEPGRVINIVVINCLRATGDVKFPIMMGLLSMWGIWVPLAWFLGLHLGWGLPGFWIAMMCDEWLRGAIMYRRWRHRRWLPHAQKIRARVAASAAGL
ncbi:MAG: MATE family efflux transporter [Nibricoccus sp.]